MTPTPGSPRSSGALRLAALLALGQAVLAVPAFLLRLRLTALFAEKPDFEVVRTTADWLWAVSAADLAVGLLLVVALAVGSSGHRALRVAAGLAALGVTVGITTMALDFFEADGERREGLFRILAYSRIGLLVAADGLLWWLSAPGPGRPPRAWALAAGLVAQPVVVIASWAGWHSGPVVFVGGLLHDLALAGVLLVLARRLPRRAPAPAAAGELGAPQAGGALAAVRQILLVRLTLGVLAAALAAWANSQQAVDALKLVIYGGTIASLGLGLGLLGTLMRFIATTPAGAAAAGLTATTLALGLLIDGWAFTLLGDLFGGRLGPAFKAADRLPWLQGIGAVVGLVGLVGLIGIGRGVALAADRPSLKARVASAWAWLAGVAVLAGLAIGVGLAAGRATALLPVALALLAAAVGLAVQVLGLLGEAADTLGRPADPSN